MWEAFHQLRTASSFRGLWKEFVMSATRKIPSQIFYQHVTDHMLKSLVKMKYNLSESADCSNNTPLTREEENSLRYVAGYICKKVKERKEDILLSLMELNGDEDGERGTEDWVNSLDRGGLWHVSDTTYSLFYAMEEEVRSHFTPTAAMNEQMKDLVANAILENDEVSLEHAMCGIRRW